MPMIRHLRTVLTTEELSRLRELAQQAVFFNGRLTNPDSTVKNNELISHGDPGSEEIGVLLRNALFRHPELRAFAFPKQLARPTLMRYGAEHEYGWHVDEALFPSTPPMRSDLSCTVFLSAPEDYAGGELEIEFGQQSLSFKLPAGDAILYPSTTIHRVAPVRSGVRLVGVTWLQSWVADAQQRELLLQIEEARTLVFAGKDRPEPRLVALMESLRANLLRMWSDT